MGHLAAVHGERVQCDMCDFQGIVFSFNFISFKKGTLLTQRDLSGSTHVPIGY